MSKARLEAFSDGVIAVAITLLALGLPSPTPAANESLGHDLLRHWPSFAAFFVSFATIGIIWINHHAALRRLQSVEHSVLTLNLCLLATVCLLPFSTALMASYLTASHGQRLAAAVYGGSLLLTGVGFFSLNRHVLAKKPHLLHESFDEARRRAILRRNAAGLIPYPVAAAAAVVSPYLTLAICAVVAFNYARPVPGDVA
jgi:uncharacterized membrane protein